MIDLTGNRYEISDERRREILTSLIPRMSETSNGFCLLEIDGSTPESDLCRSLEQQVFDSTFGHLVPHSPDMMTAEYGPYEDKSTFFAVFDFATKTLAGTVRVIDSFPNKTTTDLSRDGLLEHEAVARRYGFTASNTRDLGTVAVAPEYRGALGRNLVAASLYRVVYTTSLRSGIEHWTGAVDAQVLQVWKSLGIPFERLDELADLEYLGSHAQACYLRVANVRPRMELAATTAPPPMRDAMLGMLNGSEALSELNVDPVRRSRSDDSAPLPEDQFIDLTADSVNPAPQAAKN